VVGSKEERIYLDEAGELEGRPGGSSSALRLMDLAGSNQRRGSALDRDKAETRWATCGYFHGCQLQLFDRCINCIGVCVE